MAALQSIRSKSVLLIAGLGVALLAFILGDLLSHGSTLFNKMKDNAFAVDGQVVSIADYSNRVEEWATFEQVLENRGTLSETERVQLREIVYQQMVKEMILDREAEKLGLSVSTEELNDIVLGPDADRVLRDIPFFRNPQTGQFDRTALVQFLGVINQDVSTIPTNQAAQISTYKSVWMTIENILKYQRLEEKYTALVASNITANNADIQAYINDGKREVNIAYVKYPYSAISDSAVAVTDDEILALYNKKKPNFKLDSERRKLAYFIKDITPSTEDATVVEKEINDAAQRLKEASNPAMIVNAYPGNQYVDAYEAVSGLQFNIKSFVEGASIGEIYGPIREGEEYYTYKLVDKTISPDSVYLQMIVFPQEFDAQAANQIADSLLNEVKTASKFTEMANSFMPGSNGGDMGMIQEKTLVASGFPKNAIQAAPGIVSKVDIGGSTALIRVIAKSKPVSRAKLATITIPVLVSDKTQTGADNELAQFVNQFGNSEAFVEAARNSGYILVDNAVLNKSDIALGSIEGTRNIIQWAFTEKVGAVKKFDYLDKRVIALVSSDVKGDYVPLEEVKSHLKAELIVEKKAELIKKDITANAKSSLEEYASANNTSIGELKYVSFNTGEISGLNGFEPVINAFAKQAKVNQIGGPVSGQEGVYMLNIIAEENNSGDMMNNELVKNQINQSYYSAIIPRVFTSLKEKVKLEDNRVNFW